MCLYPKLIRNKKYTANKKNGGEIPPVSDERVLFVPIGCQACIECRRQKARQWQVRLLEDLKEHKNGRFVTLTFSNESIYELSCEVQEKRQEPVVGYELDNEVATLAVRRFLERWRKKHGKSLRHWLVTELGHNGTENVHLHGMLWTDTDLKIVEDIWKYGFVWKGKEVNGKIINYVNERTVNYVTKYVTKMDIKHKSYKSIILTSPGIGRNYTIKGDFRLNKFKGEDTNETYRTRTGHKISLPIYWRNKIYSEQERERLWLIKLDNEERWILGQRVDVSKGEDEYNEGLRWAREKNKRLGYGTDEKDWKQEVYERERRIIMQRTRIEKARKRRQEEKRQEHDHSPWGSLAQG